MIYLQFNSFRQEEHIAECPEKYLKWVLLAARNVPFRKAFLDVLPDMEI